MNSRGTLALLACLALGLGLYVLVWEHDAPRVDPDGRLLRGLQPERVASVLIGTTLEIHREDPRRAAWRIVAPPRGRADSRAVSRLLSLLEFLEPLRTVPADTNPRQLGLAPPRHTLSLLDANPI